MLHLNTLWSVIIAILWVGFFVLEGFDFGVGALHMIVGLAVLGVQFVLALRSSFGVTDYMPIELSGLYWHFVDIVWIFVFPLLYLLRT